ncbi:MAG TPA: hypothetical protein VF642_01315, partial [Propionibacteriaceae bacterium]
AVRSGETLRIPRTNVPPVLADLVDAMLGADPARRPTIAQVHATLMSFRPASDSAVPSAPTTVRSPRAVAPVAAPPARSSALRGKGLRISGAAAPPADPSTAAPAPARGLVGKLVGKLTGRPPR